MSYNGYPKNRNKKKDDRTDVMVSLKHDSEAEIGELFFSREAQKMSFKTNIGEFIRYAAPQLITGPVGPTGPAGVAGPVGPAGLEWQGAWTSGATYAIDDAVGYDGASWFCISATSGTTAPDLDPTHWALLAAQGSPGPQGPQGLPGVANGPEIIGLQVENGTLVQTAGSLIISESILIPAGTLGSREILEIVWSTIRVSGTNGYIYPYLFLNTSESLTGITQLAVGGPLAQTSYGIKTGRDMSVLANQGLISSSSFTNAVDYTAMSNPNATFTFDVNVDNYLIFALYLTAPGDKATVNRIRVTRYGM